MTGAPVPQCPSRVLVGTVYVRCIWREGHYGFHSVIHNNMEAGGYMVSWNVGCDEDGDIDA